MATSTAMFLLILTLDGSRSHSCTCPVLVLPGAPGNKVTDGSPGPPASNAPPPGPPGAPCLPAQLIGLSYNYPLMAVRR